MEEIEKVNPGLYAELGGKKTTDKKERVDKLTTEEKKKWSEPHFVDNQLRNFTI